MTGEFFDILRPLKDDELVRLANKSLRRFNENEFVDSSRDARTAAEIILILAELKWKVPKARGTDNTFAKRLKVVQSRLPSEIWDAFFDIRESGNEASHPGASLDREEAATILKLLTRLGQWALDGFTEAPAQGSHPKTEEQPSKASSAPHVGGVLPSELEQFFNFRRERATGQSRW